MDVFKSLVSTLSPLLKQLGFNKKGNNFYVGVNEVLGVVNFQKSKGSTKEAVSFTINFGVYSTSLEQLRFGQNDSLTPVVEQCHWRARVGNFMPGSPDYWWVVTCYQDLDIITVNVMEVVKGIILLEINKRLTNDQLINCWLNEPFIGGTEIDRFKGITILLKVKGDFETLNKVIENFMQKFNGRPNASIAIEHLKEIGYSL